MAKKKKYIREDEHYHSKDILGNARNHHLPAKFDTSGDGYVGINQHDRTQNMTERVLLTPAQFRALVRFVRDNTKS